MTRATKLWTIFLFPVRLTHLAAVGSGLGRAEQLETQLFAENGLTGRSLGLALIRDCNGARAFDTLLRYRGGTLAELWRALRTLRALQAGAAAQAAAHQEAAAPPGDSEAETPIKPKAGRIPGESAPAPGPAPALV